MEAFWNDLWEASRPQVISALASIIGLTLTIIIGWLSVRAASALKAVKDEKRALSLYRTIINALTAILQTKLAQGDKGVLRGVPGSVVTDAIAIVKRQNPEAVTALSQTNEQLRTKVIAKLPEVQGAVAEAAAKVEAAAR